MIWKLAYTLFVILFVASNILAQSNIDNVLLEIGENNKSIKASKLYSEAEKLRYETGLTLENPTLEYEYLNGSPANAGNQTDFLAVQSFDFPTAYSKKKRVSELQVEQVEFQLSAIKREILLEAKQTCVELIFYRKSQAELLKRLQSANKLHSDYQRRLRNGETNVLDANKAMLQRINIQNDLRIASGRIEQFTQKLTELNGGVPIEFNDIVYQLPPKVPEFDTLMDSVESNSPILKSLQQEEVINRKKIELSKAMRLPRMAAGYRYQSILGQQYQGVHLGLTIPLWESKNTVKLQEARTLFSEIEIREHINQHHSKILQLYEKYQNLSIILTKYEQILDAVDNTELANKALELGEISTIQYFMEINYFYNSNDRFLLLEKEYHLVIAELYKHRL